MTYITCITYKQILYFVTCEISESTMSTMCMNVICTN